MALERIRQKLKISSCVVRGPKGNKGDKGDPGAVQTVNGIAPGTNGDVSIIAYNEVVAHTDDFASFSCESTLSYGDMFSMIANGCMPVCKVTLSGLNVKLVLPLVCQRGGNVSGALVFAAVQDLEMNDEHYTLARLTFARKGGIELAFD